MKWLNGYRIRLVLVGFVAAVVLGGGSAKADFTVSEPTSVGPVINDATDVQECDFSHDGLELYYASYRSGGYGRWDIWVAKRETLNSPWQEPLNLGLAVNSSAAEVEPAISPDGLELYLRFWDDWNLRVCTRASLDDPWSSPVKVGPPVGSHEDNPPIGSNDVYGPDISADGLSLYFASSRVGGHGSDDIWVATRATTIDPWTEPVNLGPNVNSGAIDWAPSISADGRTLVFSRGLNAIWATTRKSIDDDWGPAVQLGISGPGMFFSPALSPDGSTLYFQVVSAWGTLGANDFWQVKFIPVVDFNGDLMVDSTDMCIMVDNWHTDNTLCDIAPLPFGDGAVDVEDLIVLSEHLFEEILPVGLIAYWKLDETEGSTAHDSAGVNDAFVIGDPVWQPDGGIVDGALQFDGIDDYIGTDFVLNPADGAFSVFAWIKGGAPGQVIISQTDGIGGTGATWLGADSSGGNLMTGLTPPPGGRSVPQPLVSEFVAIDNQWHLIGFVWDGSIRALYVDGVEVAKDTQAKLEGSVSGLYIGAGKNLEVGTFFSGLIDDVRIYNQALSAEEIQALAQ